MKLPVSIDMGQMSKNAKGPEGNNQGHKRE